VRRIFVASVTDDHTDRADGCTDSSDSRTNSPTNSTDSFADSFANQVAFTISDSDTVNLANAVANKQAYANYDRPLWMVVCWP